MSLIEANQFFDGCIPQACEGRSVFVSLYYFTVVRGKDVAHNVNKRDDTWGASFHKRRCGGHWNQCLHLSYGSFLGGARIAFCAVNVVFSANRICFRQALECASCEIWAVPYTIVTKGLKWTVERPNWKEEKRFAFENDQLDFMVG